MKNNIKNILYALQRLTRGYDDRLFWSLSEYIDPMIKAHVEFLLQEQGGYPYPFTQKKWNKVLETILKGFGEEPEMMAGKKYWDKYYKDRNKALVLLAMYWDNLWN